MDADEIKVPLSLVLRAVDCYSAMLIDSDEPRKSRGKVFTWNGKAWTCVATLSKGVLWHYAEIIEVVLAELYKGPAYQRGSREYTGVSFRSGGQVWVITDNKVKLVPSQEQVQTVNQLSLFA